jgi:hypothetical protein
MDTRRLLAAAFSAAVLTGLSAGSALAGEVTGSGKETPAPDRARSECAFSGYNDDPDEAEPFGGQSQSYGRLVAQGYKDEFPSPSEACNPSRSE